MVSKPLERQLYSDDDFEAFLKLSENNDRLFELINGEIVEKMTQNEPHALVIYCAPRALEKVFDAARFMVRVQLPIALGNSLPEPDIAVVAGHWRPARPVIY